MIVHRYQAKRRGHGGGMGHPFGKLCPFPLVSRQPVGFPIPVTELLRWNWTSRLGLWTVEDSTHRAFSISSKGFPQRYVFTVAVAFLTHSLRFLAVPLRASFRAGIGMALRVFPLRKSGRCAFTPVGELIFQAFERCGWSVIIN